VDSCRRHVNTLGAGIGQQLYHGRIYSYPAGIGGYRPAGSDHSGPENPVISNFFLNPSSQPDEFYKAGESGIALLVIGRKNTL